MVLNNSKIYACIISHECSHPSPAGCRDKIEGAKSRCKALGEGYYRLNQPASCRMLSIYAKFTTWWNTIYFFIYTQFVHHFFKEILDLLHVQNFSPPLLVPCRHNMYDGNEEFWVIVKESGKRQESHSYEEIQQKRAKAIFFWGWTYTFMDDVSIVTRNKESL